METILSNKIRILHAIRNKLYNKIIGGCGSISLIEAYEQTTFKSRYRLSRDFPKIKYLDNYTCIWEKEDMVRDLSMVNELIDIYEGYIFITFRRRVKNIINYIKNSIYDVYKF